ncbi:MAG TPA: hypothetical protein VLK84_32185 [Longimicrobium sp.]|nr:hypothetical protein [Longimicrobium sp.]
MRKTMHTLAAALVLAAMAACGGGEDEAVDETGTADTEIFTDSPDTTGIPAAGQGGTPADSVPMGTPAAPMADSTSAAAQPQTP